MVQTLSLGQSAAWRVATSARCWAGARLGGAGQHCQALRCLPRGPEQGPCTLPGACDAPRGPDVASQTLEGPGKQPPGLAGCHHHPVLLTQCARQGSPHAHLE